MNRPQFGHFFFLPGFFSKRNWQDGHIGSTIPINVLVDP